MPTFNEDMVTLLQAALRANPAASTISIGGETISYAEAVDRLERFEARVAHEAGILREKVRPNFPALFQIDGYPSRRRKRQRRK